METPFSTEAGRLEAFSDGVLAVIITIMVLELKPPHGTDLLALRSTLPTLAAYVLSFVYLGLYWNNHHHMLRAAKGIDGRAMWFNLHALVRREIFRSASDRGIRARFDMLCRRLHPIAERSLKNRRPRYRFCASR